MSTTPDPRPAVSSHAGHVRLDAWRCQQCEHPMLWSPPRCPECGGPLGTHRFGPNGTVWSSTVVRVPIPGRTPPYVMSYVDLDDGPRILALSRDVSERLVVGSRVRLAEHDPSGDIVVEEIG